MIYALLLACLAATLLPGAEASHLDDASNIPLWVSFAAHTIAAGFFGVLFIVSYRKAKGGGKADNKWVGTYHASGAFFVCVLTVVMNLMLLIPLQGRVVKDDGEETIWGRWAFYSFTFTIFAWMLQNYIETVVDGDGKVTDGTVLGSTAILVTTLGTLSLLFATLSNGNDWLFWFPIAATLWVLAIGLYIFTASWSVKTAGFQTNFRAWALIGFLFAIFALFLIFFAIGPDAAELVGRTLYRWILFAGEFLIVVYMATIIIMEKTGGNIRKLFSAAKFGTRRAPEKRMM